MHIPLVVSATLNTGVPANWLQCCLCVKKMAHALSEEKLTTFCPAPTFRQSPDAPADDEEDGTTCTF